jgi:glyoxylase-like metal-dependent hydrolase (beta-lactamase superfamily II)/rhodanese-related sulfurtransferase
MTNPFAVHVLETPSLGDRSYLISDGGVAAVIDPQRDIDRVLGLADDLGVRITHVLETHVHNDYVSGGLELGRRTGAAYAVNAADRVDFDRHSVSDRDVIGVSERLALRALHTPGHTPTHLSYAAEQSGIAVAVFTGGSLLYGATGRTDLIDATRTEELARAQHRSVRALAALLPDGVRVYPTHGFGSFCSVTPGSGTSSTIGSERTVNPALTLDEDVFVRQLVAGLGAYPAYYAHMGPLNAAGPAPVDLATPPHLVDAAELRQRLNEGEWVVDLRTRRAFARDHVQGTLSFPLERTFVTYLGWLLPWGRALTLLGETAEQVATAQRELARIGVDRLAGAATGSPAQWAGAAPRRSYRILDFPALQQRRTVSDDVVVLDVRRNEEWRAGHLDGAVHIPLHELPHRLHEIPAGEVWAHCAAGYRAAVAASILDAAGRHVVAIDDAFENAAQAGLSVTPSV